jgi:cytochrome b6-f complex iron-sulfur subunit
MAEEDKTLGQPDENEISRRQFFIKVGLTSIAVVAGGGGVFAFQYLAPNVLYEPSPTVSAGKPDRYPPDSVTLDIENGIFVVRSPQGFYALSAVCTHLGCLTVYKPESGNIACPCHGSEFRRDGKVIAGPAPRPLPWLKMWLGDDGALMVDRSTTVVPQTAYLLA